MSEQDSEKKDEGQVRKVVPIEQVRKTMDTLNQTREGFARAFLEQTGFTPDKAEMRYGEVVVDGQLEFRIWFTEQVEAKELRALRSLMDDVLSGKHNAAALEMIAKDIQKDNLRICLG